MPFYNYVIFFHIQSWWSYDSGRLIPVFVRSPWHKTNNLYGFTHLIIMNYIKLNNYLAFTFLTKIYQQGVCLTERPSPLARWASDHDIRFLQ